MSSPAAITMAKSGESAAASSSHPPRKRNRVACQLCHSRKVRCDVALLGSPCTNCRLDKHACIAREPPDRRPKKAITTAIARARARAGTTTLPVPSAEVNATIDRSAPGGSPVEVAYEENLPPFPSPTGSLFADKSGFPFKLNFVDDNAGLFSNAPKLPTYIDNCQHYSSLPSLDRSVIFSYYKFFRENELSNLPQEDVKYLEIKGSLHIFDRPLLERMLRKYFSYIHPCLPILNEVRIWDMLYQKRSNDGGPPLTISLLVFQAMIFAASAFASSDMIRACGFQSHHQAREALHRRAKLLFDLGVEVDPTSIAQATLLLSFQITPQQSHANTSLLVTAIQHARMAKAHLYSVIPGLDSYDRREKKLLWWSCLVRDRVMALGVRRHMQITPDFFQSLDDVPTEEDLDLDSHRSHVYDAEAKRMLATIFVSQCQLAAVLTSTLMLVYPPSGIVFPTPNCISDRSKAYDQVEECKSKLRVWYETNTARLRGDESTAASHTHVTDYNAVVNLHRNLTYIYYYSARIALCHHALSMLHIDRLALIDSSQQLSALVVELESALMSVIQRITNLVTLGISKFIPISMGAYYALPIILLLVDVQLSSETRARRIRQSHLRVCLEAFKDYCQIFDYGGSLSDNISKALSLEGFSYWPTCPQDDGSFDHRQFPRITESSRLTSWMEVLRQEPGIYLRLSLSLDYSLSKGPFPYADDLPKLTMTCSPPNAAVVPEEYTLTEPMSHPAGLSAITGENDFLKHGTDLIQSGLGGSDIWDIGTVGLQSKPIESEQNELYQQEAFVMASNIDERDFWELGTSDRSC